jgi:hypothetical protein
MTPVGWIKLGLVFNATTQLPAWADNSALTPLPIIHSDGHIRVFAGFRDRSGVSRIGYVDFSETVPGKILRVAKRPVLDIGRNGCFDDNGVILGDVVRFEGQLLLFYVGFQLVAKAKFIALSGLAVSSDEGENFRRVSESPFIGRAGGQNMVAAVHTARFEDGRWRFWLGAGDDWEIIDGKAFPRYGIRYLEAGGLSPIAASSISLIEPVWPEYRIGRPRVYKQNDGYVMYFTRGTVSGDYMAGRAFSQDGVVWSREDAAFEVPLSATGWDSRHLCYPSVIKVGTRNFMFYNGNDMGVDGIGCAITDSDR